MFFGIVLGPIFAILLFNMVIYFVVGGVLIIHATKKPVTKEKSTQTTIVKTFISMIGVTFLFGLSWIFAAFSVKEAEYAFEVLFTIFNATQGFFIFVFICLINQEIRQEWFHLFYGNMKHSNGNTPRVRFTAKKYRQDLDTLENSKSRTFELKSSVMSTCETGIEDSMDCEVPPQVTARRLLSLSAMNPSMEAVLHRESEQCLLKASEC